MKKIVSWLILSIAVLSLTACAATSGGETMKVKCPSCGYEFDAEPYGR